MSLFSRMFRKGPSLSPAPAHAPGSAPSKTADNTAPKPIAADRALAAAAEERALQAAIDARDVQAVARLVVAGASTQIRQAAAGAIDDPDVLRHLIREVRGGNDKNVYKVLTSKRDALLDRARKQEQLQTEINGAAEDLERHSRRAFDVLYGARLDQFERRWNAVAERAEPELRDRVGRWIDRSREIIAAHEREVADRALRAQAAADEAAEAQRLREQAAHAAAEARAEHARILEEQKRELAEKQEPDRQAFRPIGELVRKARAALIEGRTSRAAGLRQTIEETLAEAPPLPAHLASQLQQLDKQLDELKDWKNFSVTPKRAELIEEMESLVGSPLDPSVLAETIKSLRDEWRSLGKGAGENVDADAQRFREAANKAYEPCVAYFAAQAAIREENLRRRVALLVKLTEFEAGTNWEQPDWRAVTQALRETKQEWRSCAPVDPQAARPQQERFSTLVASIQARVDAEYDRNVKQKASLIERARLLLASDEVRKAIDTVKGLQQEWKTVGPVPREVDQGLWNEFRKHCDAVFHKREQESSAQAAALETHKTQALALCAQIEEIAALQGAELLARAGARVELRNAFEALGEFPRADTRELRDRLDRAMDACETAVARQLARDAERGWDDLFEAAGHVRAYRLAMTQAADSTQIETLKAAAEACLASVPRCPRPGLDALKKTLAQEHPADLAANELALRMLCIRAELLTDMPTPAEDHALRRDYQLQRLVQNMGQALRADEAQLDGLAIEWVSVGPVDAAAYPALLQRFLLCRERGKNREPAARSVDPARPRRGPQPSDGKRASGSSARLPAARS